MLHFPILVNNSSIGNVFITRQHDLIPGEPSEYKVLVDLNDNTFHVRVSHRYEDGALVLITKALAAVTKLNATRSVTHDPTLATEDIAFRLIQVQRNAIVRLGGWDQASTWDPTKNSTYKALERRGLIEWDPRDEIWILTATGWETYRILSLRLKLRVEEAREAGNEYWDLIRP